MALVAAKDQYVEDVSGIRRLIKEGDPIPAALFNLADVETREVELRSLGRVVIDADASQPSGTALAPDAGVSTDRAAELQQKARDAAKPRAKSGSGS